MCVFGAFWAPSSVLSLPVFDITLGKKYWFTRHCSVSTMWTNQRTGIANLKQTYRSLNAIMAQLKTCTFEGNSAIKLKNVTATSYNNGIQCAINPLKIVQVLWERGAIFLSSIIVLNTNDNFGAVPLLHSVKDIIKTSKPDKMLTLLINWHPVFFNFYKYIHMSSPLHNLCTCYVNKCLTRCNYTQFILFVNCSTCFGWSLHPSSGA